MAIKNIKNYSRLNENDEDYISEIETKSDIRTYSKVKFITTVCCFSGLFQGLLSQGVTGLVSVNLEKRYGYGSIFSGIILTGNDIMPFFLGPIIAFYGSKNNRVRTIAVGNILFGLGSLLYSLMHFLSEKYYPYNTNSSSILSQLCSEKHILMCSELFNTNNLYSMSYQSKLAISLFFGAQVIMGTGSIPLSVLGPSYIDDNINRNWVPFLLGTWYLCWYIGPLLGLIIGSSSLRLWIDFPSKALVLLNDEDWLGAWWLPYIIFGIINIIFGIMLLFFNDSKRNQKCSTEGLEMYSNNSSNTMKSKKQFFSSFFSIIKNKIFIIATLGFTSRMFLISGQSAFLPKFVVELFDEPPSTSGFILAIVIGITAGLGVFLGSKIVYICDKKKKLNYLFLVCIFSSLYIVIHGPSILMDIGCEDRKIVGINTFNENITNYENQFCNNQCLCNDYYDPVCGVDGLTYFSPCYSGCYNLEKNIFSNCTCAEDMGINFNDAYLKPGPCKRKCKKFYVFIILIALMSFFSFISTVPQNYLILRYVRDDEKSLSVSIHGAFLRILCLVPSPILFGKAIDYTCGIWSPGSRRLTKDGCVETSNISCHYYKTQELRIFIFGSSVVCGIISSIFYMVGFFLASKAE